MTNAFVELKDDLFRKKARLIFILKAFASLSAASSNDESNDWEAYQAMLMAQEILNQMVQRIEETLEQHLRQTE